MLLLRKERGAGIHPETPAVSTVIATKIWTTSRWDDKPSIFPVTKSPLNKIPCALEVVILGPQETEKHRLSPGRS